jgi:hypothetical protein
MKMRDGQVGNDSTHLPRYRGAVLGELVAGSSYKAIFRVVKSYYDTRRTKSQFSVSFRPDRVAVG